jgi:hypothetical protein
MKPRTLRSARSGTMPATRTGPGVPAQNAPIGVIHAASRMTLIAVQNADLAR